MSAAPRGHEGYIVRGYFLSDESYLAYLKRAMSARRDYRSPDAVWWANEPDEQDDVARLSREGETG